MRYLILIFLIFLSSCSASYHAHKATKHYNKAIAKGWEFDSVRTIVPLETKDVEISTPVDTQDIYTPGIHRIVFDTIFRGDTVNVFVTKTDTIIRTVSKRLDTVINIKGYSIKLRNTDSTFVFNAIKDSSFSVYTKRVQSPQSNYHTELILTVLFLLAILLIKSYYEHIKKDK